MFLYCKTSRWLDAVLKQDIPSEVAGFCFNLYEGVVGTWSMELIGTRRFALDDPDWPCDEMTDFNTREMPFCWNGPLEWEQALEDIVIVLKKYLQKGKYAQLLKSRDGVGVGFVEGDLEFLFHKEDPNAL